MNAPVFRKVLVAIGSIVLTGTLVVMVQIVHFLICAVCDYYKRRRAETSTCSANTFIASDEYKAVISDEQTVNNKSDFNASISDREKNQETCRNESAQETNPNDSLLEYSISDETFLSVDLAINDELTRASLYCGEHDSYGRRHGLGSLVLIKTLDLETNIGYGLTAVECQGFFHNDQLLYPCAIHCSSGVVQESGITSSLSRNNNRQVVTCEH